MNQKPNESVDAGKPGTFVPELWARIRLAFGSLGSSLGIWVPEIFGSAYLIWWNQKFVVRQRLGIWAGWLLVGLTVVEAIIAPMLHSLPLEGLPLAFRITLSLVLAVCAWLVVIHHHRLEGRLQRHRVLVDAVQGLSVEIAKNAGSWTDREFWAFLQDALQSLVFVVEQGNRQRPCVHAAMLVLNEDSKQFLISCQSPKDRHAAELRIDGKSSAAARVLAYEPDETLYIPWTRFRHGAKIRTVQASPECRVRHLRTKCEPDAMQVLDGNNGAKAPDLLPGRDPQARRSLMCSKIPVSVGNGSDDRSSLAAVLCLETNKRACLGELDFHAVKVIGVLIGDVMSRSSLFPVNGREQVQKV